MGTLEYVFGLIRVMNNDGDEGDYYLYYKCYIMPVVEIGGSSQLSSYRAVSTGRPARLLSQYELFMHL